MRNDISQILTIVMLVLSLSVSAQSSTDTLRQRHITFLQQQLKTDQSNAGLVLSIEEKYKADVVGVLEKYNA